MRHLPAPQPRAPVRLPISDPVLSRRPDRVVGLPVTGPGVGGPLPVPTPGTSSDGRPQPAPAATLARPGPAANESAAARTRLGGVISPLEFLAWLASLLPLILAAMLTFLAALLNAWALPGGGVVWRLPPELSHQFDAVAHAHATTVGLADAALALIVALIGFGHLLGPRSPLPVLSPREVAPRVAVAVLVAHGGLAIGGWAIDLHNALLLSVTPAGPAGLPGWEPGRWQGGVAEGLVGLAYALLALLLALGGWLRLALVDLLLVAAPLLAVLWILPLTAHWGEWALGLFGNLLLGQFLQVLALWLGDALLAAPAANLNAAFARDFAALALLLVALRVPGLLPGPRSVGALSTVLGLALGGRAASSLVGGLRGLGRDRFIEHELRRADFDLKVAEAMPDEPQPRRTHG
jgi:hypothetical protein